MLRQIINMRTTILLITATILLNACGNEPGIEDLPAAGPDPMVVAKDSSNRPRPVAAIKDHPDTNYIRYSGSGAREESTEVSDDLLKMKKGRIIIKNFTNDEAKGFRFTLKQS